MTILNQHKSTLIYLTTVNEHFVLVKAGATGANQFIWPHQAFTTPSPSAVARQSHFFAPLGISICSLSVCKSKLKGPPLYRWGCAD